MTKKIELNFQLNISQNRKMTQKSRGFCYTLNNYNQKEVEILENLECEYHIMGYEKGEKGTPHIQGYFYFKNARSFRATMKILTRWKLFIAKGSAEENFNYCSKQGEYKEFGKIPKQGERSDLKKITDEILEGKQVNTIAIDNPNLYHQYGRTLNKIEDLRMRQQYRTEMTEGIWYYGPTGVGKSHRALKDYTPETHYIIPEDNGWWDAYTQQETVVINDFRGQIRYGEMLQMVDKWPYFVKRRGREPLPFTSKKVIITSSLPPDETYYNRNAEDKIEQLLRRFKVYKITDTDTEVLMVYNADTEVLEAAQDVTKVPGGNTRPMVTPGSNFETYREMTDKEILEELGL